MILRVLDCATVDYMMEFTKIYDENSDNIYMRELKCLEKQIEFTMWAPRSGDLFVGRKSEAPLGFLPQNLYGTVGYYCDFDSIEASLKCDDVSDEYKQKLSYLLSYWRTKTTNEKIFEAYPDDLKEELNHEDYSSVVGFGIPLYRMSGAQIDPTRLLERGIGGFIADCEAARAKNESFYDGLAGILRLLGKICLDYADICHGLAETCEDEDYRLRLAEMEANLRHISHEPPKTFWQALQLAYLYFLHSGTYNYGRMDEYIGPFYARDIDGNVIDEDFALTLTKSLWSLMIERRTDWDGRVILGGGDRRNIEAADRFAFVAIEASRQMHDILPQLTLRCYEGMNTELYRKGLAAIGEGTTFPMLYNDKVNIESVQAAFKVDRETAEHYVPFGCGEFVIYNKGFGTPSGAINLLHGLNEMIYGERSYLVENADTFEDFYRIYMTEVKRTVLMLAKQEKIEYDICAADAPYLFFSLLFEDCFANAKPVFDGGIRFLGGTLETYGNINTSDSLVAIKKCVYDEKCITIKQLQDALKNNFEGAEALRNLLLSAPKYGNDLEEADGMAVRFHEELCTYIRSCAEKVGLHSYLAVLINNSMNTVFGVLTGASPDGRGANTYMANGNNPTGGMDKNGITAMLNSLVKLRTDIHAGSVQNMRFSKEMFGTLLDKTKQLLRVYFENGGSQSMITVLGRGDLENALKNPSQYQNLIVRVGGFSARFVELSHDIQLEILSRTLY